MFISDEKLGVFFVKSVYLFHGEIGMNKSFFLEVCDGHIIIGISIIIIATISVVLFIAVFRIIDFGVRGLVFRFLLLRSGLFRLKNIVSQILCTQV